MPLEDRAKEEVAPPGRCIDENVEEEDDAPLRHEGPLPPTRLRGMEGLRLPPLR